MILDGRLAFRCSYADWLSGRATVPTPGFLPGLARRRGFTVPPLDAVDDSASPATARVNHGRWIADCPDGCGGAEMVWLEGPRLLWCATCGNQRIGGRLRRVVVPEDHAAISAALSARPHVMHRNWQPGETLADLEAESAAQTGGEM